MSDLTRRQRQVLLAIWQAGDVPGATGVSELLTLDETAKRLRVSRRTVYREIAAKRLRITKVRGSSFVTADEIERYIKGAVRPRRVA